MWSTESFFVRTGNRTPAFHPVARRTDWDISVSVASRIYHPTGIRDSGRPQTDGHNNAFILGIVHDSILESSEEHQMLGEGRNI
jgi:hypothetical protein